MSTTSPQPKGRDDVLSSLGMAVGTLNRAEEATSVTSAKIAFASASLLLTMIRVGFPPATLIDRWLMYTGLDGLQSGLRRTGASLRRCLQNP